MKYYIKKIGGLLITMVLVSIITFGVFQILPGDPVLIMLGTDADPNQAEILRKSLGLDRPLIQQYWDWVVGIFHGDMGTSLKFKEPVLDLISSRLEATISLTVMALFLTIAVGLPFGVWLARNNNKLRSALPSVFAQIGLALPGFWLGIILVLVCSVKLKILPANGYVSIKESFSGWLSHMILPACSIALGTTATIMRYLKNTLLDNMSMDYVRTALSKGASMNAVVYKHVLRNALIPVITVLAISVAEILGGSIITEQIFVLPGLGSLLITAINNRDLPLTQGLVMYFAIVVTLVNLLVDVLYSVIDPRIRLK